MYNEYNNKSNYKFNNTCPAIGYQDVNVCVPIEIKPFAEVNKVKLQCLGNPSIAHCEDCEGLSDLTCKFTISQKIRVEVPVVFGAETDIGKACIDCNCKCEKFCHFNNDCHNESFEVSSIQ